jgi:anti-sigma regulatory factor (Ser/Thr protein kinase)
MPKQPAPVGEGTVTLSFSANLRYVRPVRHFIKGLCALARYDEEEAESLSLVTTELLNNSIEHGAKGPDDEIDVTLQVTPALFRFEVVDPGRGGPQFAASALKRAGERPDLEQSRGRGLFLIRSFVDRLDVTWDPARGTRILVSKSRVP